MIFTRSKPVRRREDALQRAGDVTVACRHCGRPHSVPASYQATQAFKNCDRDDCVQSRLAGEFPHTDPVGYRPGSREIE